jgi:hypothetical protein
LKPIWFRKIGWFYRPASATGWALTAIAVALSVYAFHLIEHRLHSPRHALLYLLPYSASLFVLLWRTAAKTSPRDNL